MKVIYTHKHYRIVQVTEPGGIFLNMERQSRKKWILTESACGDASFIVSRYKTIIEKRTRPKALIVSLIETPKEVFIKCNGFVVGFIPDVTLDSINQTAVRKWARENYIGLDINVPVKFNPQTFARAKKIETEV